MKPHISIIVARAANGTIGNNGRMPWRLPEDLEFFKQTTMGKPIIMGRKTRESIGRPLPGRRNIVISRNSDYVAEGTEVVSSLQEAIALFGAGDEVMVIGGGQIYKEALPIADTAWITQIEVEFEGDTFFPDLNSDEWMQVWSEEHPATEERDFAFCYKRFDRVKNHSY